MPLSPNDLRHLTAAEGYLELGMHFDANEELEQIDADVRYVPEVLAVRLAIYSALKKWELMQAVARKLAKHDPQNAQWTISWAYATRRAESLDAARLILLNAVATKPDEPIFQFNLACYESQLGNLEEAKRRLGIAIKLHADLRLLALEEQDLEPLWESL